jgi:hypothetical protein
MEEVYFEEHDATIMEDQEKFESPINETYRPT